jgi:hypothetical protein
MWSPETVLAYFPSFFPEFQNGSSACAFFCTYIHAHRCTKNIGKYPISRLLHNFVCSGGNTRIIPIPWRITVRICLRDRFASILLCSHITQIPYSITVWVCLQAQFASIFRCCSECIVTSNRYLKVSHIISNRYLKVSHIISNRYLKVSHIFLYTIKHYRNHKAIPQNTSACFHLRGFFTFMLHYCIMYTNIVPTPEGFQHLKGSPEGFQHLKGSNTWRVPTPEGFQHLKGSNTWRVQA